MKNHRRILSIILVLMMVLTCAAFAESEETRIIVDALGREVEVPANVESVVCTGVGALRYTCYMGAQDLVVGVEECESKIAVSRPYNYVNFELFSQLPIIGMKDEPDPEAVLNIEPDVIVMSSFMSGADDLQNKTGIPVVVVPGIDAAIDDNVYETFRILGELYGREEKAAEITEYLHGIEADLAARIADIAEEDKPTVYVGGVSFKGHHGFEGTEAHYGPFELIAAKNLANETDQTGAFNIDLEQVLQWDPEIIFVDFNGISLINEDYAANPDFYNALTAVQEGKVYSQISFRSNASNLETALADTYYAATVMYPEQFGDIDIAEKADEIFTMLLGRPIYSELVEQGYEFRQIQIGE